MSLFEQVQERRGALSTSSNGNSVVDWAQRYSNASLATMPIPYGEKRPTIRWRRWQDQGPTQGEIAKLFSRQPCNIAVICGRASKNLIVLDCDDRNVFDRVGRGLGELGIETLTVETARGGHYWLRTPQAVRSSKQCKLDIKAQGAYVLAPPSVHPGGLVYQFQNQVPIYNLPDLLVLPWLHLEPACPPKPNISRLAWRLLKGIPDAIDEYPSRSEAEIAICCALANLGYNFNDAMRLFQSNPGPGKFAEMFERNPENAIRYLSLTWHNAVDFVNANPSKAKMQALQLRDWAVSRPWPGRTGSSDRAVYLAHLSIVEQCAREPYAASARDLAERAGVHWRTASRATRRLIDAGLLRVEKEAIASLAATYRLVEPNEWPNVSFHPTPSNTLVREWGKMGHSEFTSHDVFRWGGLNKSGAEILGALLATDNWTARITDLVDETGRSRSTVNRKLRRMFRLGLVEPISRGEWRVVPEFTPNMLERAAAELNTAGTRKRQVERHRQERIGHNLSLEENLAGES